MKALTVFVLTLLFFFGLVHAGTMEYKGNGFTVSIRKDQCENLLFIAMLSQVGEDFGIAVVTLADGRTLEACWTLVDEKVILFDEEQDIGYILMSNFKPLMGI
jgi:hypothetical protein